MAALPRDGLPGWVPDNVETYLAHVVHGRSIRSLARDAGCHASTVLRQVRRFELRRDDPLVDHALHRLGRQRTGAAAPVEPEDSEIMTPTAPIKDLPPCTEQLETEAVRILRRLAEPGACLAVAEGMEKAVVVREARDGQTIRTGTLDRQVAEAMALRDWIAASSTGRIARYRITGAGRAALRDFLSREAAGGGAGEAEDPDQRARYGVTETPILVLARRRDKDGAPFLTPELVRAGERLREEFEIAVMSGEPTEGWESFLYDPSPEGPDGPGTTGAQARLAAALAELGPGLGDVTLRVCCRLEGLETVEKQMGWAARSGKIVLRIALQRLARHFQERDGAGGGLIG